MIPCRWYSAPALTPHWFQWSSIQTKGLPGQIKLQDQCQHGKSFQTDLIRTHGLFVNFPAGFGTWKLSSSSHTTVLIPSPLSRDYCPTIIFLPSACSALLAHNDSCDFFPRDNYHGKGLLSSSHPAAFFSQKWSYMSDRCDPLVEPLFLSQHW